MFLTLFFACTAWAETVAVRAPDGLCTLRAVPAQTLLDWQAGLDEEAARLQAMAARLAADAAAMRMAAAREAVPGFGDWAYGWVQSYLTAYRALGMAARGLVEGVAEADATTLPERIAQGMASPVRAGFRSQVLEPAIPPGALAEDRAHIAALIEAEWHRALHHISQDAAELPRAMTIAPGAVAARRLDLLEAAQPMAEGMAMEAGDPLDLVVAEGADTNTVFLRSMRPMAARLGAVAVRVSEAGSLVATGGAFGYVLAGSPGVVLGVVGGVGLSWGLDWVLNRLDQALSREAFEAQALEAIGHAEARIAAQASAALSAALAARRAALLPDATGCG